MSKNTRHVLGLSGGKDSAALAVHMNNNYPEIPIEYFFTDTGYELKETYDFLNKLKTRLNRPIHYINPRNSFDYFMKKYNNFLPSQNARWCTIEMKLKSFEDWIRPSLDKGEEIIKYNCPAIYRVHEPPSPEKYKSLIESNCKKEMKELGYL